MGKLITTESLKNSNKEVCPEAITYFTSSFCVSGSEFYVSGSNHECYFEDNVTYHFTCSNSKEVHWLIYASTIFGVTSSLYNQETNQSLTYYYKRPSSKTNKYTGTNYLTLISESLNL